MKKTLACAALIVVVTVLFGARSFTQENASTAPVQPKSTSNKEAASNTPGDIEERFKALLTEATLTGRWAPINEGELGEEKSGDKYHIVSATKQSGENWIVRAKMKYREQEVVMPIPVQVKFAGDTAVMIVDKLSVGNGNTYSARVMFHEKTYSGSWSGARGGGMLYGVITNDKEKPAGPR